MIYIYIIFYIWVDCFYNYYILKWKDALLVLKPQSKTVQVYSKSWHFLGGMKYALLLSGLALFRINIFDIPLFVCMRFFLYDLILNFLNNQDFLYIGSGSIDSWFKGSEKIVSIKKIIPLETLMFTIKIILMIFTILIHIRYGTGI